MIWMRYGHFRRTRTDLAFTPRVCPLGPRVLGRFRLLLVRER